MMDIEKKKKDLLKELEELPDEVVSSAYSKGFNPNDILCITCAYKSCMQSHKGRDLISNALKKTKK
jgi:hypothetical protein